MAEETTTTESVTFKGFEVTPVKGGFKGKREIADSIFKEQGITPDITKKVFQVIGDVHKDMLDFCKDQVIEKKENVELSLPVATGVTLDTKVKMVSHFPGMPKKDAEGNVIEEAVPFDKYGSCSKGISFNFTGEEKEHIKGIASAVEDACAEYCKKMNK